MNYIQYYSLDGYCELTTSIFTMLCHVPVQYVGDPKVLVLSWLWSLCANSHVVKISNLVLYSCYLSYIKLYTKAKNQLISQPIAISVETDWAMKRNMSMVNDKLCKVCMIKFHSV